MYRYSPPICYRLSTLDFLFCFAIFFSSFYVKLVPMVPNARNALYDRDLQVLLCISFCTLKLCIYSRFRKHKFALMV